MILKGHIENLFQKNFTYKDNLLDLKQKPLVPDEYEAVNSLEKSIDAAVSVIENYIPQKDDSDGQDSSNDELSNLYSLMQE